MKDKLTKKRVKIDYKNLIKGQGLWYVFKKFKKDRVKKVSDNRLMYCFCMRYLKDCLENIKSFEYNLEEDIRLAQDHSWIEED